MKAICSEDQHLSSNIPIGKSLRDVVVILDSYRVQYMIFSKDMRISMRAASEGNFKLISPVSIVVQPAVKSLYGAKAKGLIQRDELLTLTFDIEGRLESKTCKTIFTGP